MEGFYSGRPVCLYPCFALGFSGLVGLYSGLLVGCLSFVFSGLDGLDSGRPVGLYPCPALGFYCPLRWPCWLYWPLCPLHSGLDDLFPCWPCAACYLAICLWIAAYLYCSSSIELILVDGFWLGLYSLLGWFGKIGPEGEANGLGLLGNILPDEGDVNCLLSSFDNVGWFGKISPGGGINFLVASLGKIGPDGGAVKKLAPDEVEVNCGWGWFGNNIGWGVLVLACPSHEEVNVWSCYSTLLMLNPCTEQLNIANTTRTVTDFVWRYFILINNLNKILFRSTFFSIQLSNLFIWI